MFILRRLVNIKLYIKIMTLLFQTLTVELEKREVQFNAVQDRGESLVLQKHPASKCIEVKYFYSID